MNTCIKFSTAGLPVWFAMAALLIFRVPAVISQNKTDSIAGTGDSTSETSETESGEVHSAELRLSVRSRNELGDWTTMGVEGIRVRLSSRVLYPEGRRLPDLELVSDKDGLVQAPVRIGDGHIAFDMNVVSEHYHLPTLSLPRLPGSFTWPGRVEIWVTPLISVGGHIQFDNPSKLNLPDFAPEETEIRCRIFNTVAVRPFRVSNSADLISHADEGGRWRAEIPANRDSASVLLFFNKVAQIEHFYIENNPGNDRYRSLDSLKEIEDWKISMTPASKISGKVLGPEGTPAEGASIMAIPTHSSQKAILSFLNIQLGMGMVATRSKPDGSFELWLNLPTDYDLRCIHPDYYADILNINSEDEKDLTVNIPMKKSITLEGMITDQKGEEISGARIVLMSADNSLPARQVSARTRKDGRFTLNHLPPNTAVTLQIEKPESGINQKVTLVTDTDPETVRNIEVNRKIGFRISFEARDSISGMPVEGLKILKGESWSSTDNGIPSYDLFLNLPENENIYTWEIKPNQTSLGTSRFGFALSAHGYKPYVSALYNREGEYDISVKLEKWDGLLGTVVDSNGNPVEECTVFMTGVGLHSIQSGGISYVGGLKGPEHNTVTDDKGQFRLDPWVSTGKLVAYSKDGFAELPVNTDNYNAPVKLELKPLVDISGQLMKSDRAPWPNQILVFNSAADPADRMNFRMHMNGNMTSTDSNGNFHFNSMPPIDSFIQRMVNTPAIRVITGVSGDVPPSDSGRISGFNIGGVGSHCSVKILLDDSFEPDNHLIVATLTEVEELPPDHIRKNPTLLELWKKSQINRKKRTRLNRYCGEAGDSGVIHFENVESGRYKFVAQLFAKDAGANQNFKLRIVYESEFQIETGTGKKIDLGIVEPSDRLKIPAGANIKLIQ